MSDFDDDDDFADIFDDESKPKVNLITTPVAKNIDKEEINLVSIKPPKEIKTATKSLNDLFDDDFDHMSTMETVKPKENQNKPAKKILESLLSSSADLNDMNFSFNSQSTMNSKPVISEEKTDQSPFQLEYRPSTGNQKSKESNLNQIYKKNVRFSSETLPDGDLDFDAASGSNRPVTAPNISTSDKIKPKFYTRFEAAEHGEIPIKTNANILFGGGSDSNLLNESKLDDFTTEFGNGFKQTLEINSNNKGFITSDSNRPPPKQKLEEFMQSSQEEILSLSTEKHRSQVLSDVPTRRSTNDSRKGSIENLLDDRPKSFTSDEVTYGRRTSMSKDLHLERPKTSHHRNENSQMKSEGSYSVDILSNDSAEFQLKMKKLETERDDLLYKLNKMSQRNSEELEMNEKLYKNRIEILEENMKSKEKRLTEEVDLLSQQNKQKLQMLEQERLEMRSELTRRQDEIENQKRQEISRIREQHKCELDKLRLHYEDMVEKLKQAKSDEESTLRMAQPTTVQLQSVLTQVSNGAQDLVSIKQQLMDQFNRQIKEKDAQLKDQNEYLQLLKEKLDKQKDENAKERENLQSLISKLEIQLTEQTRTADEERWFLRQEQNKLSTLQASLEKERGIILLDKDQNRASLEEFRKQILDEQKKMLEHIYEEKRNMAEERAKLTREMFKWSETSQISSVKKNQEMAELEGIRAALSEERRELENIRSQLNNEREENLSKASKFDSMNYEIRMKMEKANNLEKELTIRQKAITEKEHLYQEIKIRGEESLQQAKELHSEHQNEISKIQKQLIVLNEKEQQINKQMMELEKLRMNLQNKEKTILCNKCSNSLVHNSFGGSHNNLNRAPFYGFTKKPTDPSLNVRLATALDQEIIDSLDFSALITTQMEEERLMHSIKMAADDDREYLSQERAYLDSLISGSQQSWKTHVKS